MTALPPPAGADISSYVACVFVVLFAVDSTLPFLPTRINGLIHGVVVGVQEAAAILAATRRAQFERQIPPSPTFQPSCNFVERDNVTVLFGPEPTRRYTEILTRKPAEDQRQPLLSSPSRAYFGGQPVTPVPSPAVAFLDSPPPTPVEAKRPPRAAPVAGAAVEEVEEVESPPWRHQPRPPTPPAHQRFHRPHRGRSRILPPGRAGMTEPPTLGSIEALLRVQDVKKARAMNG